MVGADFVDMARARAEEVLRGLGGWGGLTGGKPEDGRPENERPEDEQPEDGERDPRWRGADQLLDLVCREVAAQLATLGIATTDDIERIEERLASLEAAADASGGPVRKLPAQRSAAGAAPKAERAGKTAAERRGATAKSPAAKRPAPVSTTARATKAPAAKRSAPPDRRAPGRPANPRATATPAKRAAPGARVGEEAPRSDRPPGGTGRPGRPGGG